MGTALRVSNDFETLLDAMRTAAGALRDADVPFALAGSVAVYARGGADTTHDIDFLVKPEDADRALAVLTERGFRPEKPPEGWLYKAYDSNDVMVDLIFSPAGGTVDDELLARAEPVEVHAIVVPALTVTDILTLKLLALKEHNLDLGPVLEVARSVREQIDWEGLRRRTADSPYAQGFFAVATELGLEE
jgi:predicted nucleotidyltransferase